ncbi:MAG: phenylalanine--tRNA ligase subunit alpha [Actinobacteria bacterium]|nr:phenylalanine--tRNA ligase subunit alpha [Actinomycetota bacterium]
MERWAFYEGAAEEAFGAAKSVEEFEAANVKFLGRKSELKLALREVRDRESGMALNAVRERVEGARDAAMARISRAELEAQLANEIVDVTLPGTPHLRGHLHLVTQVRREVEDIFLGMGYEVVDGREVETTRYLFDALNMAPNHVTRSPLHTFYLENGAVLRSETSPSQIHTMEAKPPPVFMVSLGRCYRRDTPDATHYPIFHQVEGLVVDRGITLADLKGTLRTLLRQLFGAEREAKFVTHFFPFTEPSVEVLVSCFQCGGEGCPMCRHSGWIEIGGSGMVDPNVLRFVGYDPEEVSGFAFGWGLERMAILRHGLPDIRDLWADDLRFLRQF